MKWFAILTVLFSIGAMLNAINPTSTPVKLAPVYDATGAMLDAIHP